MKLLRGELSVLAGTADVDDFAPVHTRDAHCFAKRRGVHHLTITEVHANVANRVVIEDEVARLRVCLGHRWKGI